MLLFPLLLGALLGTTAVAQPIQDEPFRFVSWKLEQGLPQISVNALSQDAEGFLWIGTEEGLARFDGERFHILNRESRPQLGSNAVRALHLDRSGRLWIGSRRGLSLYRHGELTFFGPEDGLAHGDVRSLAEDDEGGLWIGTVGGLSRFVDGGPTTPDHPHRLLEGTVNALHYADGTLWIGTDEGLARRRADSVTVYAPSDGLLHPQVLSLLQDRRGRLWIGTTAGLTRFDGERFETVDGEMLRSPVRALLEDHEGRVWAGSDQGLTCVKDDGTSAFTQGFDTEGSRVQALWQDHEANLWVGTGLLGLGAFERRSISMIDHSDGLVDDLVWTILEHDGAVWVGSNRGLTRLAEDGTVRRYTVEEGLPGEDVRSLSARRSGGVWVGTVTGGLARVHDGTLRVVRPEDQAGGSRINVVLEDRAGTLWVGTEVGLEERSADDSPRLVTADDGLPSPRVVSLHEDAAGDLWIGTDAGLARRRGGRIAPVAAAELGRDRIKTLHRDGRGTLWIGTADGGLVRLPVLGDEVGEPKRFSLNEGLYDSLIHQVLEDDLGWMWLSSNRGVFRVRKSELEAVAEGRKRWVRSVVYGERDGMASRECNGGGHPAGLAARDGRLWFPTIRGAAIFEPEELTRFQEPVPVYIDRWSADQVVTERRPGVSSAVIDLEPGVQRLGLSYRALSFMGSHRIRTRYRLEGLEDSWNEAGAHRTEIYTDLPPGDYRFRVEVADGHGRWSPSSDALELRLRPRFHQTWAFYGLCLAALGLLVAGARGLHLLSTRRLLRRDRLRLMEAKNREIEQFAYNICHDLKSPLITVEGFVELLAEELEAHESPQVGRSLERIRVAVGQMGGLLDRLMEFSQTGKVRLEFETLELEPTVREAADLVSGQLHARGIELVVAEGMPRVRGDHHQLVRLFQNLIDNGVKFMGEQAAPRIEIDARREGERVECRVSDNGSGIEEPDRERIFELFGRLHPGTDGSGIGLALVSRIVAGHGGEIRVESEGAGRGSTFVFTLPADDGDADSA